jgi:Flp pilus assembly protein TadD
LTRLGNKTEAAAVEARVERAKKDADRLRELATVELPQRPRDPQLHAEVGTLFLRTGSPAEGLQWLNSALRLDPQNTDAHRALADHYESIGAFGLASQHRTLAGIKPSPPPLVEKP